MDSTIHADRRSTAPEPTVELRSPLAGAAGDRCAACNVPLATDQRYCVECGQRRGGARPGFLDAFAQRPRESVITETRLRRPRLSPNAAFIAGVGTLLLALGVGVLIGRSGSISSRSAPPVQVVTVSGGGGAATPTATPGAPTTATPAGGGANTPTTPKAGSTTSTPKPSFTNPPHIKGGNPKPHPGYDSQGHFNGQFFGP